MSQQGDRLIDKSTGKSKVAVVTGAARGIGKSISIQLAKQSAHVVVTDLSSMENEGEQVVKEIKEFGGEAIFFPLDITNEQNWIDTYDKIEQKYGPVDIHVNNAGVFCIEPELEELTLEQWRKTMSVNLDGCFLGTKYAIRSMKKRSGTTESASIINLSSVLGIFGTERSCSYSASKGGIRLFTKAAAKYCIKDKIRVNSIHPGGIDTQMLQLANEEQVLKITPMGRIGEPREIGDVAVFLASNEASYMTGSELVVDGGILA
jgi:3(or 17)beta-hydroxysteroid dehydrogenase